MKGVFALRAYQPSPVASTSPPPRTRRAIRRPKTARTRGHGRADRGGCLSSRKMPEELRLEHPARLHKETAGEGFVSELHRRVARVSPSQPPGDLVRGPLQAQLPG